MNQCQQNTNCFLFIPGKDHRKWQFIDITFKCFRKGNRNPERGVVVIERVNEPHGFALPGGFVDDGEQVEHAAVREMREETGLDVELLGVLGVYSRPDRDPRRHTMSVVFVGRPRDAAALKAGDDAARAAFYPLDRLPQPICFDHARILADFGRWLAGERTLAPVEPAGEDD